jgi:hypothetical protein
MTPFLRRASLPVMAALALLVPAAIRSAHGRQAAAENPFAICSNPNVFTSREYVDAIVDAGDGMVRVDAAFRNARPHPGDDPSGWDWSVLERIREIKTRVPQLDWVPILGYGTEWAADPARYRPDRQIASPMRGIDVMPAGDPRNLYGNYVFEVVSRYKGVVHAWESWNEPDLPVHTFFNGDGADFLPYQRACYLAAKQADPTCKVLFAGLCFASVEGYLTSHGLHAPSPGPVRESFFEQYLKACVKDPEAKRNNYYFDIMNQHSYSRATDLYDYAAIDRKLMRDYLGDEKPIWFTETGTVDRGGPFGGTPEEYCDYLLQSYAWAALGGVQRMFHFQLDNSNGHGLYGGMLGSPKPALTAYRDVLVHELKDATFTAQLHGKKGAGFLQDHTPYYNPQKAGYDLFEFRGKDGHRIFVAFTDTSNPAHITIPATKEHAALIDRDGIHRIIQAANGVYTIDLPGATNEAGWPLIDDPKAKAMGAPEHMVGGKTYLVVEAPAGG